MEGVSSFSNTGYGPLIDETTALRVNNLLPSSVLFRFKHRSNWPGKTAGIIPCSLNRSHIIDSNLQRPFENLYWAILTILAGAGEVLWVLCCNANF